MTYVITGSPGVGKHTIGKEVSKLLDIPLLDINEIAKESDMLEKNGDTNDIDVEKLAKIIVKKIPIKCVIVGHLAPYVLDDDKVEKIIILRRNPYELLDVYSKRRYSKNKANENIASEILGIIAFDVLQKFDKKKICQVDVSGSEITKNVEKTMKMIKGRIKTEEVDWLDLVARNKDLEKFFSY